MQNSGTRRALDVPEPLVETVASRRDKASSLVRKALCAFILFASDCLVIVIALQLAISVRAYLQALLHYGMPQVTLTLRHYVSHAWIWMLIPVFLGGEGLYTQRSTLWREVGQLMKATCTGVVAVLAVAMLGGLGSEVSRATIVLTWANLLVLLPLSRYWTKRALGSLGLWRKRILVLGAGETAGLALRALARDGVLGYEVVGILNDEWSKHGPCLGTSRGQPLMVMGPLSLAPDLMRRNQAEDILIAMPHLPENKISNLVHELQPLCESIWVVPNLQGLPMMNLQLDGFLEQQIHLLKIANNLAKPWNRWVKRSFDLVLGAALTLIALPVMVLAALMIRLDSGPPVMFAHRRLGYRDKGFRCLKFRSMHVDGDEKLAAYLQTNPPLAEEWKKYAKLKTEDPRLTRVGKFLRRWSLDELPQIFNVLKGEMSLVGPRPYLPRERERIGSHLATILQARPGMTGFWQVNGKNQLTFEDRVRLEVWYVRNWSLWLDLIILVKTFKTVLLQEHGSAPLEGEQPREVWEGAP